MLIPLEGILSTRFCQQNRKDKKGWMNANAWTEPLPVLKIPVKKPQGSTKKFTLPFSRRVTLANPKTGDLGNWR